MDRRELLTLLPATAAACVFPQYALATLEPAPASFGQYTLGFKGSHFERNGEKFSFHSLQDHDGVVFEVWQTPSGYVFMGPGVWNQVDQEKFDTIARHHEYWLTHSE